MISNARLRLREGKILFPKEAWISPSKRRIPRLLIEDRATEVGILLYADEAMLYFEETAVPSEKISLEESEQLSLYARRFHNIPKRFKRQDTLEWIGKPGNALLLWAVEGQYYIKAAKRK